ncbi:MAG: transketolase C-terminal domain-containing protein, partial [Ruminococcus callidus]|nr:transketolase C-terminal domain-containing protein [Ruminococcus callidus]
QNDHPVAVRMPCNGVISSGEKVDSDYSDLNKYKITQNGSRIAVIALGDFWQLGENTVKYISENSGIKPTLINPRYITGIDEEMLENLKKEHDVVITLEDGILDGGFGEKIARFYGNSDVKVLNYGLKKEFLDRYSVDEVMKENRLVPQMILEDIQKIIK